MDLAQQAMRIYHFRGGERMKQIASKRTKARKEHICDMCGSKIYAKENYDLETIENNGTIYNWKQCDYCKGIVSKMSLEGWYPDGISDQMFNDYLVDNNIDFERR